MRDLKKRLLWKIFGRYIEQEAAFLKKDFVANASHELRTPLTAIKGYVATLAEELSGKQKEYINIIQNHTDRLSNIVEDLLLLSSLEDSKIRLEQEKVQLGEVLNDILLLFEQKAKKKNLDFVIDIEKDLPEIMGDPFMLEQVFINLLDNAIKYTEKGSITVDLKRDDKSVLMEITDTGFGIPEKDIERIFERFYVVDKSRSRKVGGTGLGLSIVKHIVHLHGGTVKTESQINKGSKFIISLPI